MTPENPNWKSMCLALYWTVENGEGKDLDEIMEYIELFIDEEDDG